MLIVCASKEKPHCWTKALKKKSAGARPSSKLGNAPSRRSPSQTQENESTRVEGTSKGATATGGRLIHPKSISSQKTEDGNTKYVTIVESKTHCDWAMISGKKKGKQKKTAQNQYPRVIEAIVQKSNPGQEKEASIPVNSVRAKLVQPHEHLMPNDKLQQSQKTCITKQIDGANRSEAKPKNRGRASLGDKSQAPVVLDTTNAEDICDVKQKMTGSLASNSTWIATEAAEECVHKDPDCLPGCVEALDETVPSLVVDHMDVDSLCGSLYMLDPSTSNSDTTSYGGKSNNRNSKNTANFGMDRIDPHASTLSSCCQVSGAQPSVSHYDDGYVSSQGLGQKLPESTTIQSIPAGLNQWIHDVNKAKSNCASLVDSSQCKCLHSEEADSSNLLAQCGPSVDVRKPINTSQLGALGLLLSSSNRGSSECMKGDTPSHTTTTR